MAEHQVNEYVTITASKGSDFSNFTQEASIVWLWDIGPHKPSAPKRPVAPTGKQGDPEFDLAKVEFADQLEEYEAALKAWKRAKIEFEDWGKKCGGAVELRFFSCDAYDALARDAQAVADRRQPALRYFLSARTRGSHHLPNRGLPEGMKPGHGQHAQEERERQGLAEYEAAMRADPVFGKQEIRP